MSLVPVVLFAGVGAFAVASEFDGGFKGLDNTETFGGAFLLFLSVAAMPIVVEDLGAIIGFMAFGARGLSSFLGCWSVAL